MKIIEAISTRGASEPELQYLESVVRAKLPADYRHFLATDNGGQPSPRVFEGPTGDGSAIQVFFTLEDSTSQYCFFEGIYSYKNRIPLGTLPIACDSFGNLVLLDITAKAPGSIYFWDHENENMGEDEDDLWWDNVAFISPSFREFIEHLK